MGLLSFTHIVFIILGGYLFYRNVEFLRDENKLRSYLENGAKRIITEGEMDKMIAKSRKIYIPFGLLAAGGMLLVGINNLMHALY